MKIGFNATCINSRPSGARQRFVGLYGELMARLPDAEFLVYDPTDFPVSAQFAGAANVAGRRTPIPSMGRARKLLAGLRYWPAELTRERPDIYEVFSLPVVTSPTGLTVVTVHDIRGLQPASGLTERAVYKVYLARSLCRADHIITVSEAMKRELTGLCPGIPVSVIHNGIDPHSYRAVTDAELALVRDRYRLPREFVLAVGHFEARKNYLRLIDAMALLRDRGRVCPLVIVGNDSGLRRQVSARARSRGLGNDVILLGGLTDQEVRCIYRLCHLFVFPSAYEGFGIPALESMAAGKPMALSDIPPFREITQDTGVYFPHDNVELMANAIENVLDSNSERDRQVAYGNQRVQAFSFHSLGAQLEGLYRSLL
ncbi:MAG: glycosyltransferase family 1 protein [Halioglobus sp.]